VVLQPAQHTTKNCPLFFSGLFKIKAFLQQKYNKGPSFGYTFAEFLATNRDFDKFSSNKLKNTFFVKKALLGFSRLRFLPMIRADPVTVSVSNRKQKVDEPVFALNNKSRS